MSWVMLVVLQVMTEEHQSCLSNAPLDMKLEAASVEYSPLHMKLESASVEYWLCKHLCQPILILTCRALLSSRAAIKLPREMALSIWSLLGPFSASYLPYPLSPLAFPSSSPLPVLHLSDSDSDTRLDTRANPGGLLAVGSEGCFISTACPGAPGRKRLREPLPYSSCSLTYQICQPPLASTLPLPLPLPLPLLLPLSSDLDLDLDLLEDCLVMSNRTAPRSICGWSCVRSVDKSVVSLGYLLADSGTRICVYRCIDMYRYV